MHSILQHAFKLKIQLSLDAFCTRQGLLGLSQSSEQHYQQHPTNSQQQCASGAAVSALQLLLGLWRAPLNILATKGGRKADRHLRYATMLAKLSLSHGTHLTWIVEDSRSLRSFDTMSCQCQRSAHMATKCSNISKHSTLAGFQASISCISSGRSWMVNSGRRSLRFAINCSYSCPGDSEQIPTHLMSNLAS